MDALRVLVDSNTTDVECAAVVIEFTGDINKRIAGRSALQHALMRSFPQTVAALGARGDVDPHIRSGWGSSALEYAACQEGMVAVLLDAFPIVIHKLNVFGNHGETALHCCCRNTGCGDNLQLLLDLGADVTLRNKMGRTAQESARFYNNSQALDVFVKHAAWKSSDRRAWMAAVSEAVL